MRDLDNLLVLFFASMLMSSKIIAEREGVDMYSMAQLEWQSQLAA